RPTPRAHPPPEAPPPRGEPLVEQRRDLHLEALEELPAAEPDRRQQLTVVPAGGGEPVDLHAGDPARLGGRGEPLWGGARRSFVRTRRRFALAVDSGRSLQSRPASAARGWARPVTAR